MTKDLAFFAAETSHYVSDKFQKILYGLLALIKIINNKPICSVVYQIFAQLCVARIDEEELTYIQTALQDSGTIMSRGTQVPWRKIFTSLPLWAIIIHGIGNNWGIGLFYNQLPTYMKNILGFSIKAVSCVFVIILPFFAYSVQFFCKWT